MKIRIIVWKIKPGYPARNRSQRDQNLYDISRVCNIIWRKINVYFEEVSAPRIENIVETYMHACVINDGNSNVEYKVRLNLVFRGFSHFKVRVIFA